MYQFFSFLSPPGLNNTYCIFRPPFLFYLRAYFTEATAREKHQNHERIIDKYKHKLYNTSYPVSQPRPHAVSSHPKCRLPRGA
jgi:hypothetical protein